MEKLIKESVIIGMLLLASVFVPTDYAEMLGMKTASGVAAIYLLGRMAMVVVKSEKKGVNLGKPMGGDNL